MPRVLVAMSGGVDSSVAALLLVEAGYQCAGVTMRLFDAEAPGGAGAAGAPGDAGAPSGAGAPGDAGAPGGAGGAASARAVCAALGIEHFDIDLRRQFNEAVIAPFVREYRAGLTPNPCIFCNRSIKFKALLDYALQQGFDYLATGHYARNVFDREAGVYRLLKAQDAAKDQSYVLYQLGQTELCKVIFPLGQMTKTEVRKLAAEVELPTAQAEESQDICFITDGNYPAFIHRYCRDMEPAGGDIVDSAGTVLGRHSGIIGYTIGQRRGLGVAVGHPLYVIGVDAAANRIIVGEESQLFHRKALLRDFCTPVPEELEPVMEVQARYRYKTPEAAARLVMFDDGRWEVQFNEAQKALTPGQSLVCYRGSQVVAGGIIDEVRG